MYENVGDGGGEYSLAAVSSARNMTFPVPSVGEHTGGGDLRTVAHARIRRSIT
jgi:hypothetical protein